MTDLTYALETYLDAEEAFNETEDNTPEAHARLKVLNAIGDLIAEATPQTLPDLLAQLVWIHEELWPYVGDAVTPAQKHALARSIVGLRRMIEAADDSQSITLH